MREVQTINSSYYCRRERSGGPVLVLTTGDYLVAEFIEPTGSLKWHRVVQASQKLVIEKWLDDHFGRGRSADPAAPNRRRAQRSGAA